jgi:hypothetical protein
MLRALGMTEAAAPIPTNPDPEIMPPAAVTREAMENYRLKEVSLVHINNIRWDTTQAWGQIRPLNVSRVNSYFEDIKKTAPLGSVNILTRELGGGMNQLFADSALIFSLSPRTGSGDRGTTQCCSGQEIVPAQAERGADQGGEDS